MADKKRVVLLADKQIIKQIKILAIQRGQSLSVLTEELWRETLKSQADKSGQKTDKPGSASP